MSHPITSLAFQPNPNNILAVLTASNDIYFFSINDSSMKNWNVDDSPKYPKKQKVSSSSIVASDETETYRVPAAIHKLSQPLCGLVFDPSDTSKLLLYGQHTAIDVDLSLPIPIAPKQLSIHSFFAQ